MVGVAGVDRTHQGVDETLEHLVAETIADQASETVVMWRRPGEHQVQGGAGHAAGTQQAGPDQAGQAGGHAEHQTLRDGVEGLAMPDVGVTRGWRHQVVDTEFGTQRTGPRNPGQEGIGGLVDLGQPGKWGGLQLAPDPIGFEQRDAGRGRRGEQFPGGRQPGDTGTDDGNGRFGALAHEATATTRSANAAITPGSSFIDVVRAKAI